MVYGEVLNRQTFQKVMWDEIVRCFFLILKQQPLWREQNIYTFLLSLLGTLINLQG